MAILSRTSLNKLGKPLGNLLLSSGSPPPPPEYEKVQINMQTKGKKCRESEGCCLCISVGVRLTSGHLYLFHSFVQK